MMIVNKDKTLDSETTIEHLRHLSVVIGPRGSTTQNEELAAEYCLRHFQELGINAQIQEFSSPKTGWRQHSLAAAIGLISIGLAWFGGSTGSVISAIIMIATTTSVILELYFQPNLLRFFMPKSKSHNVIARVNPNDEVKKQLLIVSHIDSHRTPWVFTTKNRLRLLHIITTLGTISFFLSTIIFLIMTFVDWEILRWVLLLFIPIFLFLFILTFQPDTTPFTKGANDNASGAAIILDIARKVVEEPLRNLEIWILCSGSEEVGSYGIQAFIKENKSALKNFWGINIDNVGGKGVGVCYTSSEGMIFRVNPSPELIRLADQVKADLNKIEIYSLPYNMLHTDGTCMMLNGIPTISIVGLTPGGEIPDWHRQSDIFNNIDPVTVNNNELFVSELLHRINSEVESLGTD
jgi:hypothetical protein